MSDREMESNEESDQTPVMSDEEEEERMPEEEDVSEIERR